MLRDHGGKGIEEVRIDLDVAELLGRRLLWICRGKKDGAWRRLMSHELMIIQRSITVLLKVQR